MENVLKYDLHVKLPRIFETMYKYMLNSVVKISMMSVKYFEYYIIILRGAFFRGLRRGL